MQFIFDIDDIDVILRIEAHVIYAVLTMFKKGLIMMTVDREKYLDAMEASRLRVFSERAADKQGRLNDVRGWMLVDLALTTGLRVSEIARLTIEDIDFRRGALRVVRSKKKSQVQETMAIPKDLTKHLKAFLKAEGRKSGPLFVGQRGPMKVQGLQLLWKRACKLADLPEEVSIHAARHTLAVTLLKKTNNLRMVQKQLGHSSPTTTANMYADVSFEDMKASLDNLYQ